MKDKEMIDWSVATDPYEEDNNSLETGSGSFLFWMLFVLLLILMAK